MNLFIYYVLLRLVDAWFVQRHSNRFRNASAEDKSDAKKAWKKNKGVMNSPCSNKSFDMQIANWRMESIVRESESGSEDEFFDCQGKRN